MASAIPFDNDLPFEEKVKCFADDELLEIWVESQEMENMLQMNIPAGIINGAYFEQAIINELNIRLGKRLVRAQQAES